MIAPGESHDDPDGNFWFYPGDLFSSKRNVPVDNKISKKL
jgi:hypothetical protein